MEEGLVNALGGCCGSRPDHIAAIVKMATPCAFAPLCAMISWDRLQLGAW